MLNGKKIIVVLPSFNAEFTLEATYNEIPFDIVDDIVLVDDASTDHTVEVAKKIGIRHMIIHDRNIGYGGNQKSSYDKAMELNPDVIIMLHPDYQYPPKLIPALAQVIVQGIYPVAIGSRILGNGALKGGMPMYKYFFNRILTFMQNVMIGQKLSEYHTGYRAFSAEVLRKINYHANSDDFIFDNQMLVQIFYHHFEIAEITCPTKYFKEASSINFSRSVVYGLGVLCTSFKYIFQKAGIGRYKIFDSRQTDVKSN
jgi:glycosyltransferase involved in cell wall biosynthesis